MPNIKSAKKELRKSLIRHVRNKKIISDLKELIKKSRKAIDSKSEKASELLVQTLKALDKVAQKGIIKRNKSNRLKSRLQDKFNLTLKK